MSNENTIGYVDHGDSAEAVEAEDRAFRTQNTRSRTSEPVAQDEDTTLLADFLAESEEELDRTESFAIERPKGDWSAEFNVIVSAPEVRRFDAKGMGGKKDRTKLDRHVVAGYTLAEKNIGIYRGTGPDRKQVLDSDGDPMTFRSTEFLESQGYPNDSIAAVLKYLGHAQAITMSDAVLRAGGWAADLTPLDPTNG